ncbi:phospholipase D-like domain-containing protein [Thermococcus indicus]|nr:phospholipase D-like domain-containing protein [Thermococcus indicus]
MLMVRGNVFTISPPLGTEFFDMLQEQITNAKKRIFLGSAFLDSNIVSKLKNLKSPDVPMYVLLRDNNRPNRRLYIPADDPNNEFYAIAVPARMYHGKLYVIDNIFVVGSHNLLTYSVTQNEGEFSLMLRGDYETVTTLLFNSLYSIFVKNSRTSLNFIDDKLGALYYWGECPFCGTEILSDPFSIIKCPDIMYGGYVDEQECGDYHACKYCPYNAGAPKEPYPRHEIYLCIDGCGFGVDFTSKELVFHHNINDKNLEKTIWKFIELFNGLSTIKNEKIIAKMFRDLGFFGKIHTLDSVRDVDIFSEHFVSVTYFKNRLSDFLRAFVEFIEEDIEKTLDINKGE